LDRVNSFQGILDLGEIVNSWHLLSPIHFQLFGFPDFS